MRATASALLIAVTTAANAQVTEYPFDSVDWEVVAAESEVVEHLGQQALKLKGGFALLPDVELENAVVEYDIAIEEARGFAGLAFRLQDLGNYEHFYIRPHQSGNPDANQYTPVFNRVSAWQLYHGEGYGIPVEYRYNQWMHVKVVYQGDRAAVYIDSDEPVLLVNDLKRDTTSGRIGINAANFAPAWFANVSVTPVADDFDVWPAREVVEPAEGTVIDWQVSQGYPSVDAALEADHEWMSIQAEPSGTVNLARAQGVGGENMTVVAKLEIESSDAQQKELKFGYSDKVVVLVNGNRVYSGDNTYMSRDYRYLGTIGYFDSVTLDLQEGRNEVIFVVSEAFGGWGIQARFDNLEGILLSSPP